MRHIGKEACFCLICCLCRIKCLLQSMVSSDLKCSVVEGDGKSLSAIIDGANDNATIVKVFIGLYVLKP